MGREASVLGHNVVPIVFGGEVPTGSGTYRDGAGFDNKGDVLIPAMPTKGSFCPFAGGAS